ncbi:MAG: ATPase P [Candidatus Bathyarchaeota archaeon]|nr:ATPase P [Candidatus Bathyarchaeota archaeon]
MLEIDIAGFGRLQLNFLVSDFNGTLALDGKLPLEVKQKLNALSKHLKLYVLTSDEFGLAKQELADVNCELHILEEKDMVAQKADFVVALGAEHVVAFGNGMNDRDMLKAARLGVIILGREGCSVQSLLAADVQVPSILDGLDLLLCPKRLRATLKF